MCSSISWVVFISGPCQYLHYFIGIIIYKGISVQEDYSDSQWLMCLMKILIYNALRNDLWITILPQWTKPTCLRTLIPLNRKDVVFSVLDPMAKSKMMLKVGCC